MPDDTSYDTAPVGAPATATAGRTIAWACRQFVLWGGVALALYFIAANRSVYLAHIVRPKPAPVAIASVPHDSLVFPAEANGHVALEGDVNGAQVHFIVDTGATLVTLTTADAAAAGFGRDNFDFSLKMSTANGIVPAAPITLREVRLGQLVIDDVPAAVVEHLPVSLLGMSFLSRLDHWDMNNGKLTISW